MEQFVETISHLDITYVYIAAFLVAYLENIFPPFPSDVVVVFCGSLIAIGKGTVLLTLILSTAGSTLGFMTMYWIGDEFGIKILERQRLRFIPIDAVHKIEVWFRRYGYWIIVANRFLAGTRAVVSFFAGMSEMNYTRTTLLSALGALIWNSILVYAGFLLGDNWREIGKYITTYSTIVTIIIAALLIGWILLKLLKRKKQSVV